MSVWEIVFGVLVMICAIVIMVTVLGQEGKGGAMNAISGANDSSYLGKNKNRSNQAILIRLTRYAGILFVVVTLAAYWITNAVNV